MWHASAVTLTGLGGGIGGEQISVVVALPLSGSSGEIRSIVVFGDGVHRLITMQSLLSRGRGDKLINANVHCTMGAARLGTQPF